MIRGAAAALVVASLALPRVARAELPSTPVLSYEAVRRAPVGAWAEYLMTQAAEQESMRVRYTLVERGAKRLGIELDSRTPLGRMRVRLDFVPDGRDRWKLQKARMRMGDNAARDAPVPDALARIGAGDPPPGDVVGHEEIVVKVGAVPTEHYRRAGEWPVDVWMSDGVAPIGLVRLADGHGGTLELVASGRGGKSDF